jgi:hypothetical protein
LERDPQYLDVVDEIPGRVVHKARVRRAPAATPLIKKYDSIHLGIPESAHFCGAAATGATVQKYHRLAMRIAANLVIEHMATAYIQRSRVIRFDRRIKLAPWSVCRHGGIMKGTGMECYSY